MKQERLGRLDVARIGFGAMGMSAYYTGAREDDEQSIRTIHRAIDLGVTLIDTAEVYGPCLDEELVGRALAGHPRRGGARDEVRPAQPSRRDGHAAHRPGRPREGPPPGQYAREHPPGRRGLAAASRDGPHRPLLSAPRRPATRIEETAGALGEQIDEGKILRYGLSEAAPQTIRRAHAVRPVTALQTGYLLWTRDPESEILPLVREPGTGFVVCTPLGRGFLTGRFRSAGELGETGFRRDGPRFAGDNFRTNLAHCRGGRAGCRRDRRRSRSDRAGLAARAGAAASCRSPEHAGANGPRRTSVPTRSN
jgi:aryl-alcohol dehydrogenase-like predicted oxidoreductase